MTIDFDRQPVNWKEVLRSCSKENRHTARMWLFYTLFYWLFPTIAIVFGLSIARQKINWLDLVIHGEFLIYAITIVAGSTRLVAKDLPNRRPFINRQAFNLVSHVMIFPAIFAYGLLRYITATMGTQSVSAPIVVVYSIVLLVAAFWFSYIVFLIDAQRSTPEELPRRVANEIKHAPDKLKAQFDALQRQDPVQATPVIPPATEPAAEVEERLEIAADEETDATQEEQ